MKVTFLKALDKKILFLSKKLALSGTKATKDLKEIEKESEMTPEEKEVYDLFVEYESMPLLKLWAE